LKSTQCSFRIDGSKGLLRKEQELNAITTFLRLVNSNSQLQHQVNMTALYKKIYRRLGFSDETEIFQEIHPVNQPTTLPGEHARES
jgi:outer membrane protein assembly factor BamD (BamD/ComL family)